MKKFTRLILAMALIVTTIISFSISSSAATMPTATGPKVSNINTTSFRFDFTIKNPSKVSVPQCGAEIVPEKGVTMRHTENIVAKHRTLASCPVWYEVGKGKEFNVTLEKGRTYKIRGFCKYNGKMYYTSYVSVKIPNTTTTTASASNLGGKMYNFKQDSRWRDQTSWTSNQRPKTNSSAGYSGCAAYAYDFVKVVHGRNGYRSGTYYNNTSQIQPGDVLHIYTTAPASAKGYEHYICIYGRSGNRLLTLEGAFEGRRVRVVDSYSSSYTPYQITGANTLRMGNYTYTLSHAPLKYSNGNTSSPFGGWHY